MIKLKDGRSELYQWDTGRKLTVGEGITEVHYAIKPYGRSIDVPAVDGEAVIPDVLLQSPSKLYVWAFVGGELDGYTKLEKEIEIRRRNKPADYVFTPPDQTTLAAIMEELGEVKAAITPEAVGALVAEYLRENPVSGLVEVDDTLTQAGQAADAAKVGEVVEQLSETIANQNDIISGLQAGAYIDYDVNVKAINHRGYSTEAPENTIPAYIMSKKKGFKYVECDVAFTSDNVAVLLHDTTIDRTSDGSGNISSLTYADVLQYDFGSWKSTEYTGTTIPTFEEFIMLCKAVGLHPYIELKSSGAYTEAQIEGIVATVKAYGMEGKVTYISFNANFLSYVKNADSKARLGYLEDVTVSTITTALGLKTAENNVFMDVSYNNVTDEKIALCVANALPLEIWTVNSESVIQNMDAYITGVTSDNLIAGKILYNKYMEYIAHEKPDTPTKTLTSISATYSGGDVAVGTALTALTGIVVTATYSDGSTVAVTGYTLSGEIVEGNNTIIVTYQGMTASFTVTGVSESGDGEDTTLLYNWDFRNSNMTDSVHGETATGSVTASADGIIFKSSQHVRLLNQSYNMQDKTIEIDVVSREGGDEIVNYYCRLFCIGSSNSSATHTKTAAFLWGQSARKWSFYSGSAWADTYDATLGVGALVGKTVQLYFDNDMYCHLYINGDYFGKSSLPSDYTDGWLFMGGSASDNLYMAANVISGVRIYRGNKAAPNL